MPCLQFYLHVWVYDGNDHISQEFNNRQSTTVLGIGDDAALIDSGDVLKAISTDLLIEGVHFDLSYFPLTHLGYKAIAVNISDIAAMNAVPQQVTVSLGLSNRFSVEAIDEFYKGVKMACTNYNVDLIGGDTSASHSGLLISVTAIGEVSKENVAKRSGANDKDIICATGDLGGAGILVRRRRAEGCTGPVFVTGQAEREID